MSAQLAPEKCWFTAAELADLALTGLPKTKRKINERAADEGWALRIANDRSPLARPRMGRGGGLEYHRDILPPATRAMLARAQAPVADITPDLPRSVDRAAAQWRWFESASDTVKAEAKRRMQALALLDRYEAGGLSRSAAIEATAAGTSISASTLWSWLAQVDGVAQADRLAYLAPRRGGGGREAAIDPGAWQLLISDYLRPEQPTFASCYWRMLKGYAEPRGIVVPHERSLRRKFEREIDGRLVIAKRQGAEALRRSIPAQSRSVADLHAMAAVNIDGHKFDVFVRWPDGRIGRPMMVALQDIYSRKMLAHRIDESENALATRLAFADLFRDWGIPQACVLDNGRAFASKLITGGAKTRFRFKIREEEPTGILTALGIAIHWATPYRGQSKPIERGFRDLCDTIAKHPAFVGAYTGNKPDAKPENYGSAAVPIELFRQVCAAAIGAHNARPGRRTEMAQGRSFDAVFAQSYAVSPIGKATPEQMRLALLAAEERQCDRQTAALTLEQNRYWTPELGDHRGKKLTVRFDPDDLHTEVHVYDRAGRFIATAPVIEKSGFFDKAAAGRRRSQEAELRRMVREQAKLTDLIDAGAIAAMLSAYDDEATPVPASIVRPVRPHLSRGSAAAALNPVSEGAYAPLNTVIDRLGSHLKLVG